MTGRLLGVCLWKILLEPCKSSVVHTILLILGMQFLLEIGKRLKKKQGIKSPCLLRSQNTHLIMFSNYLHYQNVVIWNNPLYSLWVTTTVQINCHFMPKGLRWKWSARDRHRQTPWIGCHVTLNWPGEDQNIRIEVKIPGLKNMSKKCLRVSIPWIYMSVFLSVSHCIVCCTFAGSFQIVQCKFFTVVLFKYCFGFYRSLALPYEFQNELVNICEKRQLGFW